MSTNPKIQWNFRRFDGWAAQRGNLSTPHDLQCKRPGLRIVLTSFVATAGSGADTYHRALAIDGEPWLVGKDVAAALGYERGTKAVVDHVDEEDLKMVGSETQSQIGIELGQCGGWLINESGLYSLILGSKLPDAKGRTVNQ